MRWVGDLANVVFVDIGRTSDGRRHHSSELWEILRVDEISQKSVFLRVPGAPGTQPRSGRLLPIARPESREFLPANSGICLIFLACCFKGARLSLEGHCHVQNFVVRALTVGQHQVGSTIFGTEALVFGDDPPTHRGRGALHVVQRSHCGALTSRRSCDGSG